MQRPHLAARAIKRTRIRSLNGFPTFLHYIFYESLEAVAVPQNLGWDYTVPVKYNFYLVRKLQRYATEFFLVWNAWYKHTST